MMEFSFRDMLLKVQTLFGWVLVLRAKGVTLPDKSSLYFVISAGKCGKKEENYKHVYRYEISSVSSVFIMFSMVNLHTL